MTLTEAPAAVPRTSMFRLFRELKSAFRLLFPRGRHARLIIGLIVVTAVVPVSEMAVAKIFSDVILEGPSLLETDTAAAVWLIVIFFAAFGLTRAAQHLTRAYRIRAFTRAFADSDRPASASQSSWEWALAFELTTVLAVLVQALVFSAFFFALDPLTGAVNLAIELVVIGVVASIYGRQLERQRHFNVAADRAQKSGIAIRVGSRVKDAEWGSVVASVGFVLALATLLVQSLLGAISSADAIVLFLGLRLLYGQLGMLSATLMRFARATVKRGG